MKLNIKKNLVVFDLETTGLDVAKDSIIQISYIKVQTDGTEKRGNLFVRPPHPISKEVTELTGITNEMVADKPTFKELAPQLQKEFENCDFAGFNSNRFDVPLLCEEFLRAGIDFDFSKSRLIDAQTIYHKMEKRNLAAAYKFYTGHKMEDDLEPHRADQDTEATYRVLQGQLDMYAPGKQEEPDRVLNNDMDELAEFSHVNDNVDFAGRMIWSDHDESGKPFTDAEGKPMKRIVFNFGKYRGYRVVEILRKDPGYYSWIENADFPLNTKQVLTRIRLKMLTRR